MTLGNDRADEPLGWIDDELAELRAAGLQRGLRDIRRPAPGRIEINGRTLVDFGSNDYLGLACDSRLQRAACAAPDAGAAASPLISGHSPDHARLEVELAAWEGAEAALVFTSGYAANVGTVAALVGRGDAVFSDALNHASLIDGCRLSKAESFVYPHNDVDALARQLETSRARRKLIVTDGLFSMDGDLAPLVELVALRKRFNAMLLVDEAHATGVLGERGCGASEALGVAEQIDVRVGTLSKALGSSGGFVVGRGALIEWLVNRARTYVFSTALAPGAARAALAALAIVRDEPARRRELAATAADVRAKLIGQGWNLGPTVSQIVPVLIGSPDATVDLAGALTQMGLFVPAIRPPSVPGGMSRLRISLSSAHGSAEIDQLVAALAELRLDVEPSGGDSRSPAGTVHVGPQ